MSHSIWKYNSLVCKRMTILLSFVCLFPELFKGKDAGDNVSEFSRWSEPEL